MQKNRNERANRYFLAILQAIKFFMSLAFLPRNLSEAATIKHGEDEDGFKIVSSKKANKRNQAISLEGHVSVSPQVDAEAALRDVTSMRADVENSSYFGAIIGEY